MKKLELLSLFLRISQNPKGVLSALILSSLLVSCLPNRYIKPDNNVPNLKFTRLATGTSAISGIQFFSDKNGFLWTIYGEVYKTIDGALSWKRINSTSTTLGGLTFLNEKVGIGFSESPNNTGKNLLVKTTDGGETWKPIYEIPSKTSCSNGVIDEQNRILFFINNASITPQNTKRETFLLYSENDGLSWKMDKYDSLNIFQISFSDKNVGFASGAFTNGKTMLRTNDGGKSWQPFNLASQGISNAFSIRFTNVDVGILDNQWKTVDKGKTWTRIQGLRTSGDVYFVNSNKAYAFGIGEISKLSKKSDVLQTYASVSLTKDGGSTWYNNDRISIIPAITNVFFVNEKLAFGIAFSDNYYAGELIRIDITN
jgi:photosystem II stability/assembly factor-like uncharacterized protein